MAEVLVISGGIGSGKSTVCRILEEKYQWPVYEADSKVKELYHTSPTLLSDIESKLGASFRDESGAFQPYLLASRIFTDPRALSDVESLVFPVLMADFDRWKEKYDNKDFVVLESATILEKPELAGIGDKVVVVDAPVDVRIERALSRGGVTRDAIEARVSRQMLMNRISEGNVPDEVDYVIDNGAGMKQLDENIADCVCFLIGCGENK